MILFTCFTVAKFLWRWLFKYCPKIEVLGFSGLLLRDWQTGTGIDGATL
jgi:hypothetical protein